MKIPKISHETWELTRGLAHLVVDLDSVDAEQLSFEEKVQALLNLEPIKKMDDMDPDQYNYYHRKYDAGTTVTIYPNLKEQQHRPEVSDGTVQDLAEWVDTAHFAVGSDNLSFEDQLKILCEKCEEHFNGLDVYVERKEKVVDNVDDVVPEWSH